MALLTEAADGNREVDGIAILRPAFASENVPVFFCCDGNYLPHTASAIASIAVHANPAKNYDIIILGDGLNSELVDLIESWNHGYKNLRIRVVDIASILDRIGRRRFHVSGHITIASYFRFFAPDLFSAYDKILYLDSDVIVFADIAVLYETELRGFWMAACHDHLFEEGCKNNPTDASYKHDVLGIGGNRGYFNAGVILFNLEDMRRDNVQNLLFSKLQHLPNPRWHDQDILNSVCCDHCLFLDSVWNLTEWMADPDEGSQVMQTCATDLQEQIRCWRNDTRILHYTMAVKPWMWNYYGSGAEFYWSAAKLTPFYSKLLVAYRAEKTMRRLLFNYFNVSFQVFKYSLSNQFRRGECLRIGNSKLYARKTKLRRIGKLLLDCLDDY